MKKFFKNASGATAIEYGLIAALIALGIVSGAGSVGNSYSNKISFVDTAVTAVDSNGG